MANPPEPGAAALPYPDVYVADTGTAKGRGVFARRDFAQDELVEEAPVILLEEQIQFLPDPVRKVVFTWFAPNHVTYPHALVLGFGSLYNHANPANMRWECSPTNLAIRFISVRPIKVGEELTINYNAHGGGAVWHDDNWFERMQVKPIADP